MKELIEVIGQFLEENGVATTAFIFIFILYWRQQNIQKERDAAEAQAKQAESNQQDKLIESNNNLQQMYIRFDNTLSQFNETLKTAFAVIHADKANNAEILEKNTVSVDAVGAKMDTVLAAQTTSNKLAEETKVIAEDIMSQLPDLNKLDLQQIISKLDNIQHSIDQLRQDFTVRIEPIENEVRKLKTDIKSASQEMLKVDDSTVDLPVVTSFYSEAECPCCHSVKIHSRSDGWKCADCGVRWDWRMVGIDDPNARTWLGKALDCPEDKTEEKDKSNE